VRVDLLVSQCRGASGDSPPAPAGSRPAGLGDRGVHTMTMTACSTTSPSPSRCSTARRAAASQHALKVSASHGVSTRAAADPGPSSGDSHDGGTTGPRFGTGSALLIRSGRARCNRRMAPWRWCWTAFAHGSDHANPHRRCRSGRPPITGSIISP